MTLTTPARDLFVYHIFGIPGETRAWLKNPETYRLAVTGLVERELDLTLDMLKHDFTPVTSRVVLQCMTNVHKGCIEVTGVPLSDILDAAGVQAAAGKVALRAADGFTTNLKLEYVRNASEPPLAAFALNGEPISVDHGFPVRIAAPGKYGFKWPKWIVAIEAVDYDAKGHYEGKRGWDDDAERGKPVI